MANYTYFFLYGTVTNDTVVVCKFNGRMLDVDDPSAHSIPLKDKIRYKGYIPNDLLSGDFTGLKERICRYESLINQKFSGIVIYTEKTDKLYYSYSLDEQLTLLVHY